ncbi:DNA alkylation repair protein [Candidatus Cyrtobacter comes]|uniref:DNA alkylation repair protein n=1 Tax=Candidatus Cyrtobacter comes TaxID=675776 RepID=UPI002ACD5FBA|nr:DNA alkylation repair protein [Candidatus Cyrtobacter comes]
MRKVLQESIDSTPAKVSIFFKTGPGDYAQHDRFIGITVPTLRKIAKSFLNLAMQDLGLLIQSTINEERLLALIILTGQYNIGTSEQKEEIYQFYRTNIGHINNWNLVDSSAHLIIGAHLFERDRDFLEELAGSQNLWERRAAIVATWYFIRKSELGWTFKIAKLLQNDSHDLIHKAVGWTLREAGKKDEARLIAFLCDHAHQMPKTMLRYAMERLSQKEVINRKL